MKLEIMPINVADLQCIYNYLEMIEEYGEGNLLTKYEGFLNQVVLRSWKDSVQALQSCGGFIQKAQELQIVRKCVDSLEMKACIDPNLIGWPAKEHKGMHSLGGSIL